MTQKRTKKLLSAETLIGISRFFAAAILVAAFVYIFLHEPIPSVPDVLPEVREADIEPKIAAAETLRDLVNFIVTLTIGLAAIVGFVIKDGPGPSLISQSLVPIVFALFVYFFLRVIIHAFYTYGALAVQLEQGIFLPGHIDQFIVAQARSLAIGSVLAVVMTVAKLVDRGSKA